MDNLIMYLSSKPYIGIWASVLSFTAGSEKIKMFGSITVLNPQIQDLLAELTMLGGSILVILTIYAKYLEIKKLKRQENEN